MNDGTKFKSRLLNIIFEIPTTLLMIGALGVLVIILYGFADFGTFFLKVSQCLFIGIASMTFGLFIGFLFGIPKHNSKPNSGSYTSNTNLEEISDWLTKILVGLGLAQITYLPKKIQNMVAYISNCMYGIPQNVILSILIYFMFFGFFAGYLVTRIYLSKEFAKAEDHLQNLNNTTIELDKYSKKNQNVVIDDLTSNINSVEPLDVKSHGNAELPFSEIITQTKAIEDGGGSISGDQYFRQARVMIMNQNYQFAKEYFEKSYTLDKNYKAGSNAAVISSKFLSNYQEADRLFEDLTEKFPDKPLVFYNRACNYVRMKENLAAIEYLQKALELGGEEYIMEAKMDHTFTPLKNEDSFKKLLPDYMPSSNS